MKSIQALRQQRNELATEAKNLLDTNTTTWSKDVSAKVDDIYAKIEDYDDQIRAMERAIKLAISNDELAERTAKARAEISGLSVDEEAQKALLENQALNAWMRRQPRASHLDVNASDEVKATINRQIQAAAISPNSAGGFLVQTDVANQIVNRLKAFGGVRQVAKQITTGQGNPILYPTLDDTSNVGELVAEAVSATTQDVTFGSVTLNAWKYSSKIIPVSFELIQDEQVNLLALIYDILATRIGRITNTHFTTGTGTSQPQGVVTGATIGKTGATGQTLSITYDDFVDLEHSIDPAYRRNPGCAWMLHDTTLRVVKKLKDTLGRPLWTPGLMYQSGLGVGDPDRIQNYPYVINQDIPVMAANAKSVLFGDFGYYMVRDVMAVTLFRFDDSAYISKGQIAFLAWFRSDGRFIVSTAGDAVKAYANSAT